MSVDTRPTVDAPDDDPWLWLEEVEGERASAWVEQQNARTLAASAARRSRPTRRRWPRSSTGRTRSRSSRRRGGWLYNFWTDAEHPRGLWRRTTPESFRSDAPDWDVLIDLDALASAEGEDWIWGGATTRPATHDRAIVRPVARRQRCGVLREFDLEHEAFVRDGFVLPEAKGGVDWIDDDTLLLSQRLRRGRHHLGLCPHGAAVAARREARGGAGPVRDAGREHVGLCGRRPHRSRAADLVLDAIGFFDFVVGDATGRRCSSTCRPTCGPTSHHGWLVVKPRNAWTVGGKN